MAVRAVNNPTAARRDEVRDVHGGDVSLANPSKCAGSDRSLQRRADPALRRFGRPVDDEEHEEHDERRDGRDDLALRDGGDREAQRRERGDDERQSEEAGADRTFLRIAVAEQHGDVERRRQDEHRRDRELARDTCRPPAVPASPGRSSSSSSVHPSSLFGEAAHRQRRDQEDCNRMSKIAEQSRDHQLVEVEPIEASAGSASSPRSSAVFSTNDRELIRRG